MNPMRSLSLLFLASLTSLASAQTNTKLQAPPNPQADFFGASCALDRDLAVLGAPFEDSDSLAANNHAGAVYVYRRQGNAWIEEARLEAPTPAADDHFGSAIAMSGELIVIAANRRDLPGKPDSGSIFVFEPIAGSWTGEEINSANQGAGDFFGDTVDISRDRIVVGAPFDDAVATDSGAAYVFVRDSGGWIEEAKLKASDASAGDRFGAVGISADRIAVGAGFDDHVGLKDAGSVYVYQHDGSAWNETDRLQSGRRGAGESFGLRVAVDADSIVAGTPLGFGNAAEAGSADIFRFDGTAWQIEGRIQAPDGDLQENFASSVDIEGNLVIVGARFAEIDGRSAAGAAYLYKRGVDGLGDPNWQMVSKVDSGDGNQLGYGSSVAISGPEILIGAPLATSGANENGAGYWQEVDVATVFGLGCPGFALPMPVMTPASEVPRIGEVFRLDLSAQAPPLLGGAFGFLGRSNQTFGAMDLPLDLSTFNLPGCELLVSVDFQQPLRGGFPGRFYWEIPVPDDSSIVGTAVYFQAMTFIIIPSTGGFDVALSRGLRARVAQ